MLPRRRPVDRRDMAGEGGGHRYMTGTCGGLQAPRDGGVRLTRSICYRCSLARLLPPPSLPLFLSGGGSLVPGRDGRESVALPLQSYRITACRCRLSPSSLPLSLSPPLSLVFHLRRFLLPSPLCPPSCGKVGCCHLLATDGNSVSAVGSV